MTSAKIMQAVWRTKLLDKLLKTDKHISPIKMFQQLNENFLLRIIAQIQKITYFCFLSNKSIIKNT